MQDFVQFELAGRRETTLLIDTCHARHFAFGLQPQMLQGIAFQWWEMDFKANCVSPLTGATSRLQRLPRC